MNKFNIEPFRQSLLLIFTLITIATMLYPGMALANTIYDNSNSIVSGLFTIVLLISSYYLTNIMYRNTKTSGSIIQTMLCFAAAILIGICIYALFMQFFVIFVSYSIPGTITDTIVQNIAGVLFFYYFGIALSVILILIQLIFDGHLVIKRYSKSKKGAYFQIIGIGTLLSLVFSLLSGYYFSTVFVITIVMFFILFVITPYIIDEYIEMQEADNSAGIVIKLISNILFFPIQLPYKLVKTIIK